MWKYKRRLSLVPEAMVILFAGQRLNIDPNGYVLTSVDEELALKFKNAPHVFSYDATRKKEEKVVSSPKRSRTRKKKED